MKWTTGLLSIFSLCALILAVLSCGSASPGPGPATPAIPPGQGCQASPAGAQVSGSSPGEGSVGDCIVPLTDMDQFRRFFPDVPGLTRRFGDKNSGKMTSRPGSFRGAAATREVYTSSDTKSPLEVDVVVLDYGPCFTDGLGQDAFMNAVRDNGHATDGTRFLTVQGYPAVRDEMTFENRVSVLENWETLLPYEERIMMFFSEKAQVVEFIDINNRRVVYLQGEGSSKPDLDAATEKITTAMDLQGIEASG